MIGAALGQQTPKVCTCAITSCLLFRSSVAASSKSMLVKLAFISSSCCSVMFSPSSCRDQAVIDSLYVRDLLTSIDRKVGVASLKSLKMYTLHALGKSHLTHKIGVQAAFIYIYRQLQGGFSDFLGCSQDFSKNFLSQAVVKSTLKKLLSTPWHAWLRVLQLPQ